MSGLALAAGMPPAGPKQTEGKAKEDGGGLMGSLRIIEIQLIAFIVVFSASGLIPRLDIAFPVFVTAYPFLLNERVFKGSKNSTASKEVRHGSRMFQLYVALGTIFGLFLHLAYVLGGFAQGDQKAVRATTPHLFLLSAQVLSKNVMSSVAVFLLPVRAKPSCTQAATCSLCVIGYEPSASRPLCHRNPWFRIWLGYGLEEGLQGQI